MPEVHHTPEWKRKHQDAGHQTESPPKDFYSGEVFVVRASVSPVPVTRVTAWMDATGLDGGRLVFETELQWSSALGRYTGELYDDKLSSLTARLADGSQTVHFKVKYANGVEKRAQVPVRIIGSVHGALSVHRLQ